MTNKKYEEHLKKEERKRKINTLVSAIIFGVGIGFLVYLIVHPNLNPRGIESRSIDVDRLVNCLNKTGVRLYATTTCPSCKDQKARFGDEIRYVNITYCDKEKTECILLNISLVPTWLLPNGIKLIGDYPLELLANETGCTQ